MKLISLVPIAVLALSQLIVGQEAKPATDSKPFTKTAITELPIKLYQGHAIVVRGSVGGLNNLNFLFDTGAVPGVLDERVARKLHLTGPVAQISALTKKVQVQLVDAPDVQVGPLHASQLRMVVRDLAYESVGLGARIDGMIGLDLFSQSPFTVDYELKKIVFGPIDPSLVAIPYHPGLPYAVVDLEIQHQKLAILVDTGTTDLLLFNSELQKCLSAVKQTNKENWSNMGGDLPVTKAQLTDAHFGTVPWGKRGALIVQDYGRQPFGLAGLLGTSKLSTKRVAFNPVRNLLAWEQTQER